jgi:DNA polymerase-1
MPEYVHVSPTGVTQSIDELFNSPVVAFDVESTGLNQGKDVPIGISVATRSDAAWYLHKDWTAGLVQLFTPDRIFEAHHGKFDRNMAKKLGFAPDLIVDTLIASHLLQIKPADLKHVNKVILDNDIVEFEDLPVPVQALPFQQQAEYSGPHSYTTMGIWDKEFPMLKSRSLLKAFNQVEMPLVPVLSDMEMNGCLIDRKKLNEIGLILDENIAIHEQALKSLTGHSDINYNSPDQVADLFYNELKLPHPRQRTAPKKDGTSRWSTEAKYLEPLASKSAVIKIYLAYKGFQKLKGTYIDGIIEKLVGDWLYGKFNQEGTETSRLSSSEPNLQNIPARDPLGKTIREAWIAPPGYDVVKGDTSQLELRVIAHFSQDKRMLEAFRAGRDIHMETTMLIYGDPKRRFDGKTRNFEIVYGGGTHKNRELLKAAYPEVFEWVEYFGEQSESGYEVRTLYGRLREIDAFDADQPEWMHNHGRRMAVSTRIQGSAAEIVKIMMRRIWEKIKDTKIKMILQVHDELVFLVPHEISADFAQWLYKNMRFDELLVPIITEVSTGPSWGKTEKVKELV